MHRDLIDSALAARLVAAQFPEWADLPVAPVEPAGWDNRTFRLGDDMTVRLPTAAGYVPGVEKEQTWLPRLAARLPLPIPVRPAGRPTSSRGRGRFDAGSTGGRPAAT
jgi:aminoglycoside phosphotransferase (APT) family kinase protein